MRDTITERAYRRDLPDHGFAAIDVTPDTSLWRRKAFRGAVVVERRAAWRAEGHPPPVIARAAGPTVASVLRQLLPLAQSNVSIAHALINRDRLAAPRSPTATTPRH